MARTSGAAIRRLAFGPVSERLLFETVEHGLGGLGAHSCLRFSNHSRATDLECSWRFHRLPPAWPLFLPPPGRCQPASTLRACARRSRASARSTSGYTPNARSFSLPREEYFSRQYLLPEGVTRGTALRRLRSCRALFLAWRCGLLHPRGSGHGVHSFMLVGYLFRICTPQFSRLSTNFSRTWRGHRRRDYGSQTNFRTLTDVRRSEEVVTHAVSTLNSQPICLNCIELRLSKNKYPRFVPLASDSISSLQQVRVLCKFRSAIDSALDWTAS